MAEERRDTEKIDESGGDASLALSYVRNLISEIIAQHGPGSAEPLEKTLAATPPIIDKNDPDKFQGAIHKLEFALMTMNLESDSILLQEAVLEEIKRTLGEEHYLYYRFLPAIMFKLNKRVSKPEGEEPIYERIVETKKKFGNGQPTTFRSMKYLAELYEAQPASEARLDKLRKLREDLVASGREAYGPDHEYTLDAMGRLAKLNTEHDHSELAE